MKQTTSANIRTMAVLLVLSTFAGIAGAQSTAPVGRVSLAQDWSHRHVLYSNTATMQQSVEMKDPRVLHNWIDRAWRPNFTAKSAGNMASTMQMENVGANFWRPAPFRPVRTQNKNSEVDWAVSLGTGGQFPTAETPAKFQFDVTKPPDCTNDFVVFPILATPSATQANIIAINNLYSGTNPTGQCGTAPTVMWAYKLGSAGTALSPALSFDGKKIAFIETGNRAILHILTPQAGQGTSATSPFTGTPNDVTVDYTTVAGTGCTNAAAANSNASPFVDYSADGVFVAADNGILYHVKNVFGGTPTMDFCTVVTANATLTSPVYDANVKKAFISDGASVFSFDFSPTTGFSNKKSVTVAGAGGIILSPMIDNSSQMIYVFSASNPAGTSSIVSQIPYSMATHVDANIGARATGLVLNGTFDNNFYVNPNATTWTMYACGRTAANGARPALYGLTFAANGVMNSTPLFSANANVNPGNANGACSPLQEFFNGGTDRMFVSTTGSNTVSMFDITTRLTATSTATATAAGYSGGTGNFAVDNTSSLPQASSIYFGTMGTSTTTCPLVAPTPTLTEVHATGSSTTNSSTLTVTIPATTAGSLIVVAVGGNATNRSVSSVTDNATGGSDTFTQVTGARQTATNSFTDVWAALKTTGSGATTVTITYNNNLTRRDAVVWVVNGFTNAGVDVVAGVTNGVPNSLTSNGASVTTTAANEFVIGYINTNLLITANPKAPNEFTSGGNITGNGDGGVSLITTAAGAHQPVWSDSGSGFSETTVAFKESVTATANYCAVKLTQGQLK